MVLGGCGFVSAGVCLGKLLVFSFFSGGSALVLVFSSGNFFSKWCCDVAVLC